jgi:aryl-phospho-beta-D-glucosidase BglC (GH1 family)
MNCYRTKSATKFNHVKSHFQLIVIFICLVTFSQNTLAQGFLRADGKKIINDNGNVLLRGIGLGGWMLQEGYMLKIPGNGQQHKIRERIAALLNPQQTQEFYDTWLSNHTRKIDIDSLKSWGFNSVRLPMHYNLYTLPVEDERTGTNTWLEKGFILTDSLLSWCKANRMYLVLDLHAAPGGQGNDLNISDGDSTKPSLWASEANRRKTIALWKKIAERYAGEQWIAAYDILNEPNYGFTDPENDKNGLKEEKNEALKKLLVDITAAIREVDKKHMIIIEGNGWGNNYNGMLPTWDNNMVLSFHKYWNFNDQSSIQKILDIREKYNVPVWLGETGENSNVWFTQAINLLETNNIGWAWWPLKKIGNNNPLEIKSNLNYEDLLKYWNSKGPKPKESNVYSGLLELATYTKFETNIFHKDVIDAMFRQPFSSVSLPFKKHVIEDSILINATDYDLGKNGIAYFDNDTANYRTSGKPGIGNRGRIYRNDGVDIRKDSASYESYYVADIEKGEWLQYTVDVRFNGIYKMQVDVATEKDGRISITSGTKLLAKNIQVPPTGGFKKWKTIDVEKILLKSGRQPIRIYVEQGGFNLKNIRLTRIRILIN